SHRSPDEKSLRWITDPLSLQIQTFKSKPSKAACTQAAFFLSPASTEHGARSTEQDESLCDA
ncbi:MAG: hypothetical protein LW720_16425, partial [Pirellula sp.]|nr:hypothetical protein [Pirellula sp.]